jgi:hypothetical protein
MDCSTTTQSVKNKSNEKPYQVMRITTETSSKTGSPRLLRHASNRTLIRKSRERSLREADVSAMTISMQVLASVSLNGFGFRKMSHEQKG